jgi:hypothetical protein
MKDELYRIARANGERARVKAARVAAMLKVYRRDPDGNDYLRSEAQRLAKKVIYHMHQAVVVGGLIEQIEVQQRQAIARDGRRKKYRSEPHGLR